jgi:hypothetical protein
VSEGVGEGVRWVRGRERERASGEMRGVSEGVGVRVGGESEKVEMRKWREVDVWVHDTIILFLFLHYCNLFFRS